MTSIDNPYISIHGHLCWTVDPLSTADTNRKDFTIGKNTDYVNLETDLDC
jgi:hypothetical protein